MPTDLVAPGDYDGDGKYDMAIQRPGATANSQSVFWILRSSDLGASTVAWGLTNDLVVPGDYDGDGKTDIAVVREGATPTTNLTWYILRSSDANFEAFVFGDTGTDITAQNDYDGDGKCDAAIWRDPTGDFWIRRSSDGVWSATHWGQASDLPVAVFDMH